MSVLNGTMLVKWHHIWQYCMCNMMVKCIVGSSSSWLEAVFQSVCGAFDFPVYSSRGEGGKQTLSRVGQVFYDTAGFLL